VESEKMEAPDVRKSRADATHSAGSDPDHGVTAALVYVGDVLQDGFARLEREIGELRSELRQVAGDLEPHLDAIQDRLIDARRSFEKYGS
jgi:hypothetical protein